MRVSRTQREQKGKKKWKGETETLFLKDKFLASRGWGACRVISPNPTWNLSLPPPQPDATLSVTFRRRSTLQHHYQHKKGAGDPYTCHPHGPEAFCEWCQLGQCFGEQIPAGECQWSPLPLLGLPWRGQGSTIPHQPATSAANSRHPVYRLVAAFAE